MGKQLCVCVWRICEEANQDHMNTHQLHPVPEDYHNGSFPRFLCRLVLNLGSSNPPLPCLMCTFSSPVVFSSYRVGETTCSHRRSCLRQHRVVLGCDFPSLLTSNADRLAVFLSRWIEVFLFSSVQEMEFAVFWTRPVVPVSTPNTMRIIFCSSLCIF